VATRDAPSRRPAPFRASIEPPATGAEPPRDAVLFECAWEVCNQVGGIHQVLRSKVPLMVERWRERYVVVGPYVPEKAAVELEPGPAPAWLQPALDAAAEAGLVVHTGRWLVPGRPPVLLVEAPATPERVTAARVRFRTDHRIELDGTDAVVDRAVTFGVDLARLFEAIASYTAPLPLLAHFHEWQGGVAIPIIRHLGLPIRIGFTTHATILGRYMAPNEAEFYERLPSVDHEAASSHYGVRGMHHLERACAHGAHVVTTVSPITGEECTHLLGRTPDVITPNGLNIARYNVGHDFQTFHADFKERLHAFVAGHFFPSYTFDLEQTLYMFTSGRFEPRNKGFDLCLETMARLDGELRARKSPQTIVFFIVTARPTRSIDPEVLEKRGVLNELREVCERIGDQVGDELFRAAAAADALPSLDSLVDEYWSLRLRRTRVAFRRRGLPPITTHAFEDRDQDPIVVQLRHLGLTNAPENRVKVVYHPEFINPTNPLWGLDYDQFVRGCHLGLFPSTYEPWGYTPLECMALGTPAISSDLAGFGRYVQELYPYPDAFGIQVLPRRGRSFEDAAADLTRRLLTFCQLTRRDRVALRNEVEKHSWDFDWARLGTAYHEAHARAFGHVPAG
jgi:glycogen(starch) synthase